MYVRRTMLIGLYLTLPEFVAVALQPSFEFWTFHVGSPISADRLWPSVDLINERVRPGCYRNPVFIAMQGTGDHRYFASRIGRQCQVSGPKT
jgi:hypothetical protein